MNSLLDTLRQLGPLRLAVLGIVTFMLLGFFVFISLKVSTPGMKPLYNDLTPTDSAAVSAKLEESGIAYQVSPDGSRIVVAESEVGRARMLLAQEGLPNGGSIGYELFDQQTGFGTTNFVQNINQVRALEGELARTIGSLGSVASARVHLVLPQRELFSRESRPSSASVFLKLRPNTRLQDSQVIAIQSLVSSAVPGLQPTHVSIIDSNGNLLARAGTDDASMMPLKSEEMRQSYEARMTAAIEDIVSQTVGFGKVRATVTADFNFDRISTNEELYDPNTQVVRSSQTVKESNTERDPPPSDVSVQNNLPANFGNVMVQPEPNSQGSRNEETTNYEISKTVRNLTREVGEVKRLSVAVLVDGAYTTDAEGKKTYQPRAEAEIKQIETLVRSAIGFDEKRGDQVTVVNMPFTEVDVPDMADEDKLMGFEKADLLDAAQVIVVAIMIIFVVLLVLQPMIGRLLASTSGPALEEGESPLMLPGRGNGPAALMSPQAMVGMSGAMALPPGQMPMGTEPSPPPEPPQDEIMINVQRVEGRVKASALKKVEDIVQAYPNETVSVLRSWISQE